MPLIRNTNNRVLNPNARAADVAKSTVKATLAVQQRKLDAAFQVDGYEGILYSILTHGEKCACQSKRSTINSVLDKNGKASIGVINELLTSNEGFGIRAYGADSKSQLAQQRAEELKSKGILEVDLGQVNTPVPLASLFDESDIDTSNRSPQFNLAARESTPGRSDEDSATLLLNEADSPLPVESGFDSGLFGYTDVSCPICFGSGFIGGYAPYATYREVLTFQHVGCSLPAQAVINIEENVPSVDSEEASWRILLPLGAVSVDALRVWNLDEIVPCALYLDNVLLTKPEELLLSCNGGYHTLKVKFDGVKTFTHIEVQINQSDSPANFALPKLSRSSDVNIREVTTPFQVFLSPRIPYVKMFDVLVESTYGKALQVKEVSGLNTNQYVTLGWEVDVRPVQPQELFWMLPRRQPVATLKTVPIVRDNQQTSANYTRT